MMTLRNGFRKNGVAVLPVQEPHRLGELAAGQPLALQHDKEVGGGLQTAAMHVFEEPQPADLGLDSAERPTFSLRPS